MAEDDVSDPKRGFKDHQDFVGAVMRASTGGPYDERLAPLVLMRHDHGGRSLFTVEQASTGCQECARPLGVPRGVAGA
jgi:hypothetical protein